MASVSFTFFGFALDHRTQAEAQEVEFGSDGSHRWQLLGGVAFAVGKLLADFGRGQTTIQARGLEGRVGLEMVLNKITNIRKKVGQVDLHGLTATCGAIVQAEDPRTQLMLSFTDSIASPAKLPLSLTLAEVERLDRFRHEPSAFAAMERPCRFRQQGTHCWSQFHCDTSCAVRGGAYCTDFQRTIYFLPLALPVGKSVGPSCVNGKW
jgi:hypothetical protein